MAYIGSTPVPQGIKETQSFTATAGQTTFNTLGYSNGNNISVFLNGVRLINGTDYTATNGSDIVLTAAASASDVLDFETFNEFNLVNQNLTTPTFTDTVVVSGDTTASLTLKNNTHEDTDGGRESTLIFQGEQSGGEISTLAEIEASHDGTADDQKGDLIFKTNDGSDGTSPTEVARMDSAANFLVSTTGVNPHNASSASDAGAAIRSDGRILAGVNQDNPAVFNRIGNDGDIVAFKKGGSTVGSIGTASNAIFIGTEDAGITFNHHGGGNLDAVFPYDLSTGASDANVDLGGTLNRFRDMWLSGGIHLGGTGSANKLEDYEVGTWTPTLLATSTNPTYSSYSVGIGGAYVKIGSVVHVWFDINISITNAGSGTAMIGGLPITPATSVASGGYSTVQFRASSAFNLSAGTPITGWVYGSNNRIYPESNQQGNTAGITYNPANGVRITGMSTYYTTA